MVIEKTYGYKKNIYGKRRVMKKAVKISIVVICMFAAVFTGYTLFEKGMFKTNSDTTQQIYSPDMLETVNLEIAGENITIGEDPQLIITGINTYVDKILLKGLNTTEELQIFFKETGSEFTESESITVIPQNSEAGAVVVLGKNVTDIRIDFNGTPGTVYTVSEVVINPAEYMEWGVKPLAISIVLGMAAGSCLVFMISETKNFKVYVMALKKYRYLLEDMVIRDIKLKYRRSVIGLLWSILNPLLMMCVITAVFQNIFRFTIENFAVYYLTGWVMFNFVTEATTGAMTSILNSSALIRKVYIPKYIFPMQKCVFSFVNMLFSLIALIVVMLVLKVDFTLNMLLIPVPLILALVFSIGIGMILATAAVFFRDIIHLYTVFTMVWMYLTPIIYPLDILSDAMIELVRLNPMYYYVDYFRQLTLYGTVPGLKELGIMAAWSAVSLIIGMAVFKKKQDRFILFI